MKLFSHKPTFAQVIRESLIMILGAVLIWRGMWVLLDRLDMMFLKGNHELSAVLGIVLGIAMVYYVDRDLEDVI